MMLKILQISTVTMFVLMVIGGVLFIIFAPDKLPQYVDFMKAVWPIFLMEVIPAFLGGPLSEYVKKLKNDG